MTGPETAHALTPEQRDEIERALTGEHGVVSSVFVDMKARVTVRVELPGSAGNDGMRAISNAVTDAVGSVCPVVSTVLAGG
jgi:hypothetical protein